jgi:lipopolysaccharide export LptBFGC system permease protein LptF
MNELKNIPANSPNLKAYLQANLAAWVFVFVLAVAAFFICGAVWDDVTTGVLEFIFVVLGGGFTLVSLLDFFYEKSMGPGGREDRKS